MKNTNILLIVLSIILLASCRTSNVPSYLLEKSEITMQRGYGSMCYVKFFPPKANNYLSDNSSNVIGELIGVDDSSIVVLQYDFHKYLEQYTNLNYVIFQKSIQNKNDTMRIFKIPRKRIELLQLVRFKKANGMVLGHVILTTVWSFSHGMMLVFTMPFNLLMDFIISYSYARNNLTELFAPDMKSIEENLNSRFPQGLDSIDLTTLKPKILVDD